MNSFLVENSESTNLMQVSITVKISNAKKSIITIAKSIKSILIINILKEGLEKGERNEL